MNKEYVIFYHNIFGEDRKVPKNVEKNIDAVFPLLSSPKRNIEVVESIHGFHGKEKKTKEQLLDLFDYSNNHGSVESAYENVCYDILKSPYCTDIIYYGKKTADEWRNHPSKKPVCELHFHELGFDGRIIHPLNRFFCANQTFYVRDFKDLFEELRQEVSRREKIEKTTEEAIRTLSGMGLKNTETLIRVVKEKTGINLVNEDVKPYVKPVKNHKALDKVQLSVTVTYKEKKKMIEIAQERNMTVTELMREWIRSNF